MNPMHMPKNVQSSRVYYHTLISSDVVHAARRVGQMNGLLGVSFAGAWLGYGFHEDGFASGAHAADIVVKGRESVKLLELIHLKPIAVPKRNVGEKMARKAISAIQRLL